MSALMSMAAGLWYAAIAVLVCDGKPLALLFTATFGAAGFILASAGTRLLTGHADQAALARRGAWLALVTTAMALALWAVQITLSGAPATFARLGISHGALWYVALVVAPGVLTLLLVRTRAPTR
ncbi:hypothetical protein [Streptomyces sp. NBC_00096]|uniref:hypothetical protein n=1 Tax=Streptomyces sp. NBC_00096 TaxID=2975650 RepID=UPI003247B34D